MFRRVSALLLLLFFSAIPALALQPDAQGTVRADGATLAWRSYGQGSPLLLITGYGATMDAWPEDLLADLSAERRVIVFDNRGMAFSTASDKPFSYALFMEDAAAVLRGLHIDHAEVMGWSMGSCLAQELALAHPEMVDKLVLYATDMDSADVLPALRQADPAAQSRPLEHLFPAAWLDAHPDYLQRMPVIARTPDPAVVERQRQAIAAWTGTRERLKDIRQPALLVVGAEDAITKAAKSREIAGLLGGPAWLAVFENAGHGLMFQAPHALADTVIAFLTTDQTVR